jgi:UDP-glucose 4-epimerase
MTGVSTILLTGGAGYIGSHLAAELAKAGHALLVLDNLITGRRENLSAAIPLVLGDFSDEELLSSLFKKHNIKVVIHLAGRVSVAESMQRPSLYRQENFEKTVRLIDFCKRQNVTRFVFSSTATVYDTEAPMPLAETSALAPASPYAMSKKAVEDYLQQSGLPHFVLRYFNVAGASKTGPAGPSQKEATHLIRRICQTVLGMQACLTIFGDNYPTPDGTCLRDYIFVEDLAAWHSVLLANEATLPAQLTVNLGQGRGYSVKEIVRTAEKVIGKTIPTEIKDRRAGDVPMLVAATNLIHSLPLQRHPAITPIDTVIETALLGEKRLFGL